MALTGLLVFGLLSLGRADDMGAGPGGDVELLVPPSPDHPLIDYAPLWDAIDFELQGRLERSLRSLGFSSAVRQGRVSVALVDITDVERPRVAQMNGDEMMYAASLPKIAILLSVFEKIGAGQLRLDPTLEGKLTRMIRRSSNTDASDLMDLVGKEYIATVLQSPKYRLYDRRHNGGLWCGKNYAQSGLWRRDPLHNLSHGATAMQVARFYYLLETGRLVSPQYSRKMKQILANSALRHKFVRGIKDRYPQATLFRKSGSWDRWHSDSAIIEHDGHRYIAVALTESLEGARWLRKIVLAMDDLVCTTDQDGVRDSASPATSSFPRRYSAGTG